jgi:hypothetical protein
MHTVRRTVSWRQQGERQRALGAAATLSPIGDHEISAFPFADRQEAAAA